MPSPLAHGVVGWWLHRHSGLRGAAPRSRSADPATEATDSWLSGLLGFAVFWGLSILPDFDFLPGLWSDDVAGWHNGPSHSLAAGVLVAMAIGPLIGWLFGRWLGGGMGRWTLLTLVAYWGHVVLDALTQGRGVKLLWPWLHDRLAPPFAPFYGVRWSEGLADSKLGWTLANELAFVVLVVSLTLLVTARRGTATTPAPAAAPRIGLMLRSFGEQGGIGIYTRHLLHMLMLGEKETVDRVEWVLLWRRPADRRAASAALGAVLDGVEQHVLGTPDLPLIGKVFWDQARVPWAARRLRLDALLHPKFTAPFAAPCPVVMTVHGADWWDPAEARFYGRLDRLYVRATMPLYFRRCRAVVSVSEQSTDGFRRALGEVADAKLRTVPFGPGPGFVKIDDRARIDATRRRYGLPRRFLLTLGKPSAWERKNMDGLIAAYRAYAARVAEPLPLVVGGPEPKRLRDALSVATDESSILFPGWIDPDDLPTVHAGAVAFVYPSHLEAFPIPLAEAMACGTPIITSDRDGPVELVGDAARRVDPDDPEALTDALIELLDDPEALAELARRGLERAERFSWPTAAARVRAIVLGVLSE